MRIDSEKLRRLRMQRVLSLRELAKRAGIDHGAVMFIERGDRQPRPSTIRKLAIALGVEPEELILWDQSGHE